MKTLRSLLALILAVVAIVAILTPPPAQAYDADTVTLSTNSVAATTTNLTTTGKIYVGNQSQVAVQVAANLAGSGTSVVGFKIEHSVDGTNFAQSPHTLLLTANGTNTVYALTNFSVVGYGWLNVSSITNPNASAVTNIVVRYGDKKEF